MTTNSSFESEVRPADGRAITQLPPGVYAAADHPDVAIFVWETGTRIDVAERLCPHNLNNPREDRKDLVVHGKVSERDPNGNCVLRCFHRRFGWKLPSGQTLSPLVPSMIVFPSKVVGNSLVADLSYRHGAA